MEHKSDSNDSDPSATGGWDDDDRSGKEFDDAVTSELSVERFTAMAVVSAGHKPPVRESGNADDAGGEPSAPRPTANDKPLAAGYLLGDRFEIVALVHSGGMGHVYKAIDKRRHRQASEQVHVAIKMMRRSLAPRLDAQLALEREAAKTQHLSHPNIVNVFDFDQHDGQFYLVMEWLEGESVNALLRRTSGQRLEPQFAWQIVEGIARGLQNAHSNNVVHADINPSNIFITETHEIKLLDFGVARYANDPKNEEGNQSVWVTRTYASPEVLSGKTPTFEDDIFALGCVAYRLLSGTHPFGGSPSIEAQQAGFTVPRIPGLAQSHWRTLNRALSYDRADRPNTASVFYKAVPEPTALSQLADKIRGFSGRQWLVAGSVAAVLLAVTWWLSRPDVDNLPAPVPDTAAIDGGAALDAGEAGVDASAAGAKAASSGLLGLAAVAIAEQRLVTPKTANARTLYREVLALDPGNADAMAGLRAISDLYVGQANAALASNDPQQATAALAIASETDFSNPAIAIAEQLLSAQATGLLSKARLAVAEGDTQRAQQLLAEAERFPNADAGAISALTLQIENRVAEERLLARLEVADAHIRAGRLLTPASGNAQASLLQLKKDYPGEPRLVASINRQAERLLARAGFAVAAGDFDEATTLLAAVGALGVMPNELSAARSSLQGARGRASIPAEAPAPAGQQDNAPERVASEADDAAPSSASADDAAPEEPVATATAVATPPAPVDATDATVPDQSDDAELQIERSASSISTGASTADLPAEPPGSTMANEASPDRVVTLADLQIQRYVEPRFPRSARRRDIEGFVELQFRVNPDGSTGNIEILRSEPTSIFAGSAEKAVSQWQFAEREDAVTTKVTLNFKLAP